MFVLDYITLLTPFTRELPRFSALAGAVFRQAEDLIGAVTLMYTGYSLEEAQGKQLDVLAATYGLSRSDAADPSDETFRAYIKAKLSLWRWNGTNETIKATLQEAFPGSNVSIVDNCDLTVTAANTSDLPGSPEDLLPVPAGVRIR